MATYRGTPSVSISLRERPKSARNLLFAALPTLLVACTATYPFHEQGRQMVRQDEQIVKGIGIALLTPESLTSGPQHIVATLAVGTRTEMSNVSAVWLTSQAPLSGTRRTVRMFPTVDYTDGFGATVSFTEAGLWRLDIQVFRVGGIPATATFTVTCCEEEESNTGIS
ncbi:MAG TPA: hypothetical protein VJ746_09525 [Nitrospira sp.]|nr:hypothetical protein [Nitrospira sp.]